MVVARTPARPSREQTQFHANHPHEVDVSEPLPELLKVNGLAELGVTRAAAEAVMRHLPVVQIEGL
jgi:hypothetical protein